MTDLLIWCPTICLQLQPPKKELICVLNGHWPSNVTSEGCFGGKILIEGRHCPSNTPSEEHIRFWAVSAMLLFFKDALEGGCYLDAVTGLQMQPLKVPFLGDACVGL